MPTTPKEEFAEDIKPSFATMDEDRINEWFKVFTRNLRDKGAVVRTLKTEEVTHKDAPSVFEAKYEWEYQDGNPVTVVNTAPSQVEAVQKVADQVFARRHEV